MTEFRVHFIKTDGDKTTHVVNADSPAQAAAIIRRKNPGVTVLKIKVNKAGNVSVRQAVKSGVLPEFKFSKVPDNFDIQDGDKAFIEGVGNVTLRKVEL